MSGRATIFRKSQDLQNRENDPEPESYFERDT